MEKFLVTSALPYANGPLHVGHIAGAYLPADIYVRFLRLNKKDVVYICGTDEHGVPITLAAEKQGVAPGAFVAGIHAQIKDTFARLGVSFDNFSGTARPVHYEQSTEFFLALDRKGFLEKKTVVQLFCARCARFLPDRYVEGTCPKCSREGARGDQCESCGSDLDQTELVKPYCKICGKPPVLKETFHWFLRLKAFEPKLKAWLDGKKTAWKENVVNFCAGLLNKGLPDRAVTRDMEWGVPVPLPEGKGKVIYVWFDAPIGYISSTIEWAREIKKDPDLWKSYWQDPECQLVHFIGKDNIVFHSIMWPAVLMGVQGYVLPHHIPANEFLNLEGRKVSTSRGYAIWVHEFLDKFPPDTLRYYLAAIAPETKDADFLLKEFKAMVNGELADILGNLVNRTVTFVFKYFEGKTPPLSKKDGPSGAMLARVARAKQEAAAAFSAFQVRRACTIIMGLCRDANKFFNDQAPWKTRKDDPAGCADTLHACLFVVKALSVIAFPVIPFSAQKIQAVFNPGAPFDWESIDAPLSPGAPLSQAPILFQKIEDEAVEAFIRKLNALNP
jgi:methionyl-tRNA synthetase